MSAWSGSTRRSRLPADWPDRRRRVLGRDRYRCRLCAAPATEVDHIVAGDNHDMTNLQAICPPCHKAKTAQEAQAARVPTKRPRERHPGLK